MNATFDYVSTSTPVSHVHGYAKALLAPVYSLKRENTS